jgi:UDP-N-acetylglucosamine 2-epimerase
MKIGFSARAPRINLVHSESKNYAGVQEQILGAITKHLEPGEFSTTVEQTAPDRLNFSLFILQPTDVLMSHGLADKNYFLRKDDNGERISNRLAHLFVPGKWHKRRLLKEKSLELGPERIHVVGWPRLDILLAAQKEMTVVPREPGVRPKVLWAPTHDFARRGENNDSNSSYPELLEYVPMFEKHFDFEMSLHPRNREDKQPTRLGLLDCDYVISDFGTMVYEAWALGKPVIFPHWLIGDRIKRYLKKSAEAKIYNERLGLHADSAQQIVDLVMDGAGVDARTHAFMDSYVEPAYAGRSGERVAERLRSLSASGSFTHRAARALRRSIRR